MGRETLLVVDDEPNNVDLIRELAEAGLPLEFVSASNGMRRW